MIINYIRFCKILGLLSLATTIGAQTLPKVTLSQQVQSNNLSETADTVYVSKFLNVDTSTLYVDAVNNRVGIGTSSPSEKLTINEGEVTVTSNSFSAGYGFNLFNTSGGSISKGRITSFGSPGDALLITVNGVYAGSGVSFIKDDPELAYWDISLDPRLVQDRIAFRRAPRGAQTNLVEFMRIDSTGKVGIGTTSPSYQLQLSTDSAAKPSTNTWTVASDSRVKKNIIPYNKGLDIILQLNPIEYDYNGLGGFTEGYGGIGFIAQELKPILPEAVSSFKTKLNPDDDFETELLNYNAHALPFIFINAFKEQQAIIETQQAEIETLKTQIQNILTEINNLKNN